MTFAFKRLYLKNWLVYQEEDVAFADFSEGRNLFVFHGMNGFGKTSLLKALQYVFHGEFSRDEAYKHWNDNAKKAGEGEMIVSLEFVHDGRMCKLTRRAEFAQWGNTYKHSPMPAELIIDGDNQEAQVKDVIEQIIPKECQQFIFFDGAEITRYAQRQHEDGVKDAIEQILGIPAVRNLRDDLERLVSELEEEQAEIVRKSGKQENLLEDKQQFEDLISEYEEKKKDIQERYRSIQSMLSKLQKEEIEIQALESDMELLREKEERVADYEDQRATIDSQIQTLLADAPLFMLQPALSQIIAEEDAKQSISAKKLPTVERKRIIQEVLEEGVCICGRETDTEVTQLLETMLGKIETASTSNESILSRNEINTLSRVVDRVNANSADGEKLLKMRATINTKIVELETDISELREKLEGHQNTNIADLYQQRRGLEEQRDSARDNLKSYQENIDAKEKQLSEIQRELDRITVSDSAGEGIMATLVDARNMYKAVSQYVNELIELKRQEIQRLTSEIMLAITNKPDEYAGVHVKQDYTLQVYRHDDSVVDNERLSAGEKEVLAYSFITALNLSSSNPAPFLMDTPFGHLDSGHRQGLLDSLPRLGVQVFLLATDRDLPYEERDRIQGSIVQEFILDRDQKDALTHIRGVD